MKIIQFIKFLLVLALCSTVRGAEPSVDKMPGSGVVPPNTVEQIMPAPTKDGKRAGVKIGVWIGEDGAVESAQVLAGKSEWREAALAAVKRWRFEPVKWQGKPIPARTEVSFVCAGPKDVRATVMPLPNLPGETHSEDEFGLSNPELLVEPEMILPLMVRVDGRRIEAALDYVVNQSGGTAHIVPLSASSESALRCALDLVAERSYKPATIRGQPVAVKYSQNIGFMATEPPINALRGAKDIVDPAYPYERLLAGEEGYATVRLTLDAEGGIASTELVEASHPDFGGALIAAVESWQFSATTASVEKVREYRHEFFLKNVPYAARRLVEDLRAGKSAPRSGAGLDARPEILGRPALGYPRALIAQSVPGSAEVEFVIDRTGLAQLARVMKASSPEFGWAAATCVNGMRFKPLTRGGKPAELRVVLPFDFTPPVSAEAAPAP